MSPTESKIRSFAKLKSGWHYGEGKPPSSAAVEDAVELLRLVTEINPSLATDAFPGIDGEIQLTVYCGIHCLEFTRECSGAWTFFRHLISTKLN